MTSWRPEFDPEHLYFVTTTAIQHRHFFKRAVMKRLIIDCMDCMRLRKRFKLYSFVVMPNHVHMIIQCQAEYPVASVMRDFKRHISDRVIRQYQVEGNQAVLGFLASAACRSSKQKYKVWEDDYNAKDVFTPEFLRQKMEYVHNNPCQPHWNLVPHPDDYIWSTARFYLAQKRAIIPFDNANLLFC